MGSDLTLLSFSLFFSSVSASRDIMNGFKYEVCDNQTLDPTLPNTTYRGPTKSRDLSRSVGSAKQATKDAQRVRISPCSLNICSSKFVFFERAR